MPNRGPAFAKARHGNDYRNIKAERLPTQPYNNIWAQIRACESLSKKAIDSMEYYKQNILSIGEGVVGFGSLLAGTGAGALTAALTVETGPGAIVFGVEAGAAAGLAVNVAGNRFLKSQYVEQRIKSFLDDLPSDLTGQTEWREKAPLCEMLMMNRELKYDDTKNKLYWIETKPDGNIFLEADVPVDFKFDDLKGKPILSPEQRYFILQDSGIDLSSLSLDEATQKKVEDGLYLAQQSLIELRAAKFEARKGRGLASLASALSEDDSDSSLSSPSPDWRSSPDTVKLSARTAGVSVSSTPSASSSEQNRKDYENFKGVTEAGQMAASGLIAIGQAIGSKDLQKVGQALNLIMQGAQAMASIVLQQVTGAAIMGPIGLIAGVLIGLFSLLTSKQGPSFEEMVLSGLQDLRRDIADLREHNDALFAALGRGQQQILEVLQVGLDYLARSIRYDLYQARMESRAISREIRVQLAYLARQLREDSQTVFLREFNHVIENVEYILQGALTGVRQERYQEPAAQLNQWLHALAFDDVGNGITILRAAGGDIINQLPDLMAVAEGYAFETKPELFYNKMGLWGQLAYSFISQKIEDEASASGLEKSGAELVSDSSTKLQAEKSDASKSKETDAAAKLAADILKPAPNINVWFQAVNSLANLEILFMLNFDNPGHDQRLANTCSAINKLLQTWQNLGSYSPFWQQLLKNYQSATKALHEAWEAETQEWEEHAFSEAGFNAPRLEKFSLLASLDDNLAVFEKLTSKLPEQAIIDESVLFDGMSRPSAVKLFSDYPETLSIANGKSQMIDAFSKDKTWPIKFLEKNLHTSAAYRLSTYMGLSAWQVKFHKVYGITPVTGFFSQSIHVKGGKVDPHKEFIFGNTALSPYDILPSKGEASGLDRDRLLKKLSYDFSGPIEELGFIVLTHNRLELNEYNDTITFEEGNVKLADREKGKEFNRPTSWAVELQLNFCKRVDKEKVYASPIMTVSGNYDITKFTVNKEQYGTQTFVEYLSDGVGQINRAWTKSDVSTVTIIDKEEMKLDIAKRLSFFRLSYASHMRNWMQTIGKPYLDCLEGIVTAIHAFAYLGTEPRVYQKLRTTELNSLLNRAKIEQSLSEYSNYYKALSEQTDLAKFDFSKLILPKLAEDTLSLNVPEAIETYQKIPSTSSDKPSAVTEAETLIMMRHPVCALSMAMAKLLKHLSAKAFFAQRYPALVKAVDWDHYEWLKSKTYQQGAFNKILNMLERIIEAPYAKAINKTVFNPAGLGHEEIFRYYLTRVEAIAERIHIHTVDPRQAFSLVEADAIKICKLADQPLNRLEELLTFEETVVDKLKINLGGTEYRDEPHSLLSVNMRFFNTLAGFDVPAYHYLIWQQGIVELIKLAKEYKESLLGTVSYNKFVINVMSRFNDLLIKDTDNVSGYAIQQQLLLHKLVPNALMVLINAYEKCIDKVLAGFVEWQASVIATDKDAVVTSATASESQRKLREMTVKHLSALSALISVFVNSLYRPEEFSKEDEFKRIVKFFADNADYEILNNFLTVGEEKDFNKCVIELKAAASTLAEMIIPVIMNHKTVLAMTHHLNKQLEHETELLHIDGEAIAQSLGLTETSLELGETHLVILERMIQSYPSIRYFRFEKVSFANNLHACDLDELNYLDKFFGRLNGQIDGIELDKVRWPESIGQFSGLAKLINQVPYLQYLNLNNLILHTDIATSEKRLALSKAFGRLSGLKFLYLRNLDLDTLSLEAIMANLSHSLVSLIVKGIKPKDHTSFAIATNTMPNTLLELAKQGKLCDVKQKMLSSIQRHCPNLRSFYWPDLYIHSEQTVYQQIKKSLNLEFFMLSPAEIDDLSIEEVVISSKVAEPVVLTDVVLMHESNAGWLRFLNNSPYKAWDYLLTGIESIASGDLFVDRSPLPGLSEEKLDDAESSAKPINSFSVASAFAPQANAKKESHSIKSVHASAAER